MTVMAGPGTPAAQTGMASGEADLWCTYAAVRTLAWLDEVSALPDAAGTIAYLEDRRNADGGYAWMKGMPSDSWAAFYCTQALADLGASLRHADRTRIWLRATFSGGGYAMMPGQAPDVWATHFSSRTSAEVLSEDVPKREDLLSWLAALQTSEGGLSWTPGHAADGRADVRACHYGVSAWKALTLIQAVRPPWDVPRLVAWIQAQQAEAGGFRFGDRAAQPCMWATFRACAALAALGERPLRQADCIGWIHRLRGPNGAFVRWTGYDVEDVWASFCAVGALRHLNGLTDQDRAAVTSRIAQLAVPGGGFTYREPELAGDVLTTAAAILARDDDTDAPRWRAWLNGCQLPNEDGVMYMPARGAEIRCTLWALAAGALDSATARKRVTAWLAALQNPDGGFGYWEGRASDVISTAAAVEIAELLGAAGPGDAALNLGSAWRFVTSCAVTYPDGFPGHAALPGGKAALRPGLQATRVLSAVGGSAAQSVWALLARHAVPGGGFADQGARLPDLLTTYEAVATADRFGIQADGASLRAFLDRVTAPGGYRWTPLSPGNGGPLAGCLGHLLARRLAGDSRAIPVLALS